MTKEKDLSEQLMAGYLDVKVPARQRRRRFGPSRSWRRHWVEAQLATRFQGEVPGEPHPGPGPGHVVELLLCPARLASETGVIKVPAAASICRTTSRSRNYAFVIAVPEGVGGGRGAEGKGPQLNGEVYLAARSEPDMERWIAVLRGVLQQEPTLDAGPLLRPQPRAAQPRALTASSAALLWGRRLSRSEGDLLAAPLGLGFDSACECVLDSSLGHGTHGTHSPGLSPGLSPSLRTGLRVPSPGETRRCRAGTASSDSAAAHTHTLSSLRQPFRLLHARRRAETLRVDSLSTSLHSTSGASGSSLSLGKIASGLLSAGLGLILSTPGGSEAEDDDQDQDEHEGPQDAPDLPAGTTDALDRRRESAVSVASGIYEEIQDASEIPKVFIDRLYENALVAGRSHSNGHESHYEDPALLFSPKDAADKELLAIPSSQVSPPPLPPRQNLTPIRELLSRSNGTTDPATTDCNGMDSNGYVQMDLMKNFSQFQTPNFISSVKCAKSHETEPTYLPMSPIRPSCYGNQKSPSNIS